MPSLPASYVTGTVVFNALVSLGDINGDGSVDPLEVNGSIDFAPERDVYRSDTSPVVIVGNKVITSKVVAGQLVRATGAVGERLPAGRWHATFNIPGMSIPTATIDVQDVHTDASPLDLGKFIDLPSTSLDEDDLAQAEPTMLVIVDTGDGGYVINGQDFMDSSGKIRSVSITDNPDGSADIDLGTE